MTGLHLAHLRRALLGLALMTPMSAHAQARGAGHYAKVNGITMYYEVHGSGRPLVLIHGGGSTIQTSFGKLMPLLAKTRQVIAVEERTQLGQVSLADGAPQGLVVQCHYPEYRARRKR